MGVVSASAGLDLCLPLLEVVDFILAELDLKVSASVPLA